MTGEEGAKVVRSSKSAVVGEKDNSIANGQSQEVQDVSKTGNNGNLKDRNSNDVGERGSSASDSLERNSSSENCYSSASKNGQSRQSSAESDDLKEVQVLGSEDFKNLPNEKLLEAYQELARYADTLKKDNAQLKEADEKLRMQQVESSRRENVLVMRLNTKEQELQDYMVQLNELKQSMAPSSSSLRNALIDPAVNLIIQRMKKELDETKKKLEDTQNDLNAWKFTPDSNTGKRLMAKCRMLYQENEDLGKMITTGRLAKLESDLALQRSLTDEMKKSQSELDELIQELDEDVEGMQGTIYFLQQQLRNLKTESNSASASGSGTAGNANAKSNDGAHENVVSLLVKITELCAQCQATHKNKQQQQQPSSSSVKMEIDDSADKNDGDRTLLLVNGETLSPSPSDSSERLNASPLALNSSNNSASERTARTTVTNVRSELNDNDSQPIISDSESQKMHIDEDLSEQRTKSGEISSDIGDPSSSPPAKRHKLANAEDLSVKSNHTLDQDFVVEGSECETSHNGSTDH